MLENLRNLNKFKIVSVLTSALYFYLFVSLLLFPESVFKDFGVVGNETVYFLARRASTLMLGFSVLLFLVRNTPLSTVRQAIAFSISLNMAGFALLGSFELIRGFVGTSILNAIVIEVLVAVIYFSFGLSDKRFLQTTPV
jgi:hypothetical protein